MSEARSDHVPLRQEDWNFTPVPDYELEACLRYELAREVRDFASYYGLDKDAIQNRLSFQEDNNGEIFPEEDWNYIGIMFVERHTFPPGIVPAEYPSISWQGIPNWFRARIVNLVTGLTEGIQTIEFPIIFHTAEEHELERRQGTPTYRLRINWNQSDASLVDDFKRWLFERRPPEIKPKIHRGTQSIRDDLNALTAMRLRHHYRTSEASKIFLSATGKLLFADGWGWERAVSRGIALFKIMFPAAGDPLSATSVSNRRGRPPKAKTVPATNV